MRRRQARSTAPTTSRPTRVLGPARARLDPDPNRLRQQRSVLFGDQAVHRPAAQSALWRVLARRTRRRVLEFAAACRDRPGWRPTSPREPGGSVDRHEINRPTTQFAAPSSMIPQNLASTMAGALSISGVAAATVSNSIRSMPAGPGRHACRRATVGADGTVVVRSLLYDEGNGDTAITAGSYVFTVLGDPPGRH